MDFDIRIHQPHGVMIKLKACDKCGALIHPLLNQQHEMDHRSVSRKLYLLEAQVVKLTDTVLKMGGRVE